MTPNRIWEAEGPPGVEGVLREWLADPDEEIASVEAVEPGGADRGHRARRVARPRQRA